jgi:steroid 5-alpha reductase family enzyme
LNSLLSILGFNLIAILVLMLCAWVFSLAKRDASVADIFWGLGFVLVAWLTFGRAQGYLGRKLLLVLLTTIWGLRLAIHILRRNRGKGEDPRYRAMRAQHGGAFWWVSLFTVFGLQSILLWLISLVVQVGQLAPLPDRLTWIDGLGTVIWAVGFGFEAIADRQLARFKADPYSQGQVMDRGLWAYSRHPNYFGESLLWWGIFVIGLATPGSAWTVISPLLITYLLLKVSGVTLLEKTIVETRPAYRDYIKRTSAFIPWLPRRKNR